MGYIGLFGMASFMAEQRIKEIGIRKVLGATVVGLWGLLSKDLVKFVMISLAIAIPTAYYFMRSWLQHYSYQSKTLLVDIYRDGGRSNPDHFTYGKLPGH